MRTLRMDGCKTQAGRLMRAVAAALALSVAVSLCGFTGQCNEIRGRVLRLHVLANSNSKEDQQLKLKVRDCVAKAAADAFGDAENQADALMLANDSLDELRQAAQQCVYDEGYDYQVNAELAKMYFTTRRYGAATLPAGTYDALRITIGDGRGDNWWCVVFPPLCVSAAAKSPELSDVLEPGQEKIVAEPQSFQIRFKVVEIFEGIANFFRGLFD